LRADAVFGSSSHSAKIEGVKWKMERGEMKTAVFKIGEKINASAVYQREIEDSELVYYDDDDAIPGIGTFHVKKL